MLLVPYRCQVLRAFHCGLAYVSATRLPTGPLVEDRPGGRRRTIKSAVPRALYRWALAIAPTATLAR